EALFEAGIRGVEVVEDLADGRAGGADGFEFGGEFAEWSGDEDGWHCGLELGDGGGVVRYVNLFFEFAQARLDHARLAAFADDGELRELTVSFVNLREQRTGRHRDDRVPWDVPAELLANLEAHRLAALGVIRAQVHVHETPAVFAGDLGAEAIHLIVSAVNGD